MKKIFLIVVLSFCFCLNASAASYTLWSDWGEYTEDEPISSDLIDVRKERRYNYYKYNKVLGPYGTASLEYPFIDTEDTTRVCTQWSDEPIEESSEYEVETKEFYHYKKAKPVNKVTVKIEGDYSYKSAAIYSHDEMVSTTLDPDSTYDFLIFHLDRAYDADELDVKLFEAQSHSTVDLIYITIDGYADDEHYTNMITGFNGWGTITAEGYHNTPIKMDDYYTIAPMTVKDTFLMKDEGKILRYRKCQNEYRTYALEKEYYGIYTASLVDDYILYDEEDYKDYYSYRQREYIMAPIENTVALENNTENQETNEPTSGVDTKNIKVNEIPHQIPEKETTLEVLGETIVPKENITVPKLTSNNLTIDTEKGNSLYKTFSLILLLILILILTLSKLYKRHKKGAKV